MSLYTALKAAGCEIDNHESDLYIRCTPEACKIMERFEKRGTPFTSNIDGKLWFDVPFMFEPWWTARAPKVAA